MSEFKRDLNVPNRDLSRDLAICNAATPGPWRVVTESIVGFDVFDVMTPRDITVFNSEADAKFCAEARTGWPHAIERALAAEKEVARLTGLVGSLRVNERDKTRKIAEVEAEVERLRLIFGHPAVYRALKYWTDELDLGSPDDWEVVYAARVAALKMTKEATADDQTE
jgi:hypothetical protein